MAYFLSNERNKEVVGAYRRYQEYLRQHEQEFPPSAFALATAEWYQNPNEHRCPHDGWLENLIISETVDSDTFNGCISRWVHRIFLPSRVFIFIRGSILRLWCGRLAL